MEIKVFYAWQDDLPSKVTRSLIRDAAEAACLRLTQESAGQYAVVLDQATEGIPGMCDIPNVILEKIDACDVFLPDLTFVGQTAPGKRVSNPNILFELGHAAKSRGFDRVLAVMNTAYGEPESQMFDVKRRWAIRYALAAESDSATRKKCRDALSNDLYEALKVIIAKSVLPAAAGTAEDTFERKRNEFEGRLRRNEFGELTKLKGTIAICVIPERPCEIPHERLQSTPVPPPGGFQEWESEVYGDSVQTYNGAMDEAHTQILRYNVTETWTDGATFAADSWYLSDRPGFPRTGLPMNLAGVDFIGSADFERLVVNWLRLGGATLQSLGVPFPWRVGLSLLDIKGYRFLLGQRQLGQRTYPRQDLICKPVRFESADQIASAQDIARIMRPRFDFVWREFGHPCSMNFDASGNWRFELQSAY